MKLSVNCYAFAERLLENPAADPSKWDLTDRETRLAMKAADDARSGRGISVSRILTGMEAYLSAIENAPRDEQDRQVLTLEARIWSSHPR